MVLRLRTMLQARLNSRVFVFVNFNKISPKIRMFWCLFELYIAPIILKQT